jgi:catechol 2,3-dioxygenase-like lactoylglutathione lyase family enzyme
LHLQRKILFHGHEPLDTDSTPNLEGEDWLMHNGYTQAEGVANLDQVPEAGALVVIGYPKFGGGLGGYARYIAVCPSDWPYGVMIGQQDAPLPKSDKPLHYDADAEFAAIFERIKKAGLSYGSAPWSLGDGELNDWNGGRGVYFKDPNGHVLELMTVPQ